MKLAEAFSWLVTKNCTFQFHVREGNSGMFVQAVGPGAGLPPLLQRLNHSACPPFPPEPQAGLEKDQVGPEGSPFSTLPR